jgi:hypothetical protein
LSKKLNIQFSPSWVEIEALFIDKSSTLFKGRCSIRHNPKKQEKLQKFGALLVRLGTFTNLKTIKERKKK